jgi:hypothetical protein
LAVCSLCKHSGRNDDDQHPAGPDRDAVYRLFQRSGRPCGDGLLGRPPRWGGCRWPRSPSPSPLNDAARTYGPREHDCADGGDLSIAFTAERRASMTVARLRAGRMQLATVTGKPDPDRSLFQGGMASRFRRSDADAAVPCDRPLSRSERSWVLPVRVQSSNRRQSDSRSAAKASMDAVRSRPSHID